MDEAPQQTFAAWLDSVGLGATAELFGERYLRAAAFPPTPEAKEAAWEIHVQLRTRIATQDLPLHSGNESGALTSLWTLFELVRTVLAKHGPAVGDVGVVVMTALNEDVRPVTAFWQAADGEVDLSDDCGDFRADLRAMQADMCVLADFLGYVARGKEHYDDRLSRETPPAPVPEQTKHLSSDIHIDELPDLALRERATITKRAETLGLPVRDYRTGLAISGGGIRSATFALGVLSVLSRAGLYRSFDYLSTVSGGGYLGTFLSTWARAVTHDAKELPKARLLEGPLVDPEAVARLRDHSRYLADLRALGSAAVPLFLGILGSASALVVTTALTLPLAFLGLLALDALSKGKPLEVFGWTIASIVGVLVMLSSFHQGRAAIRHTADRLYIVPFFLAPAAGVWAVENLVHSFSVLTNGGLEPLVGTAVALPAITTIAARVLARWRRFARLVPALLALSPWLAYVGLVTWLSHTLGLDVPSLTTKWFASHAPEIQLYLGVLLAATLVVLFTDVNESSPRGFYRARLADTYCFPTPKKTDVPMAELSELAPIHLVNATTNLPSTRARNDRGRRSAPFVFSRHGWTYPKREGDRLVDAFAPIETVRPLDVATAMAISGAAVSPMMGTTTPTGASPWLTLLNLRLSYWLPNPGKPPSAPWGWYLLRELLERVDENAWRLNLSDGGHFENLGIYELLRRRCKYIVAIDGEADPRVVCGGLMNVVRLAKIDFGADIRVDVRKLRIDDERFSSAHVATGRIRYRDGSEGTLLYVKLSVTGDEPGYVLSYRDREPVFPHHSTADQVYSEEQFEAYRALGAHVAEHLFRTELVGDALAKTALARFEERSTAPVELEPWLRKVHATLEQLRPSAAEGRPRGRPTTTPPPPETLET